MTHARLHQLIQEETASLVLEGWNDRIVSVIERRYPKQLEALTTWYMKHLSLDRETAGDRAVEKLAQDLLNTKTAKDFSEFMDAILERRPHFHL